MKTIESCATPDGRISCELISKSHYGATVFSVHVYESNDNYEYNEIFRSYQTGDKRKARIIYKQYCNQHLRNRSRKVV